MTNGKNTKGALPITLCALIVAFAQFLTPAALAADGDRPNLVVIVADDMGFSDLGSFGGEIRTPNLDALASGGLRFTNFYVSASCSPTRSMLMTGLDNHVVGLGNMHERTAPNQLGLSGYEGVMLTEYPTIAEVLRDNGYHTYMAGKWHLGHEPSMIPGARGFERSFSLLNAAGSHFDVTGANDQNEESEFTEDGQYLEKLPKGYYSSRTFTDKLIGHIGSNRRDGKPFFAHLAFQAPHDPLQVPDKWLRRYTGDYDIGWDELREQRLERMKALGIVPPETEIAPRLWYVPEWDDLTGIAQATNARRMEIYASMVEYMDQEVGRLVDYLRETGELDNTVIVFFSDNGPNPNDPVQQAKKRAGALMAANFYATEYRTAFESWGRKDGFVAQSAPWAQVSPTPFSGFKLMSFEGGIRSPLVIWSPNHARAGEINTKAIVHVSDLPATLLDYAGIDQSELFGSEVDPRQRGISQRTVLNGESADTYSARQAFGTEMFGGRAYREGNWKITWMHAPFGKDRWELFDLSTDPSELNDLSVEHPKVRARLIEAFNAYAASNNVTLPDRTIFDGIEDNLPPRPPVDSPAWPRGQEKNWSDTEENDNDE